MLNVVKAALMSAVIGAGSLVVAAPAIAQDGIYLEFGRDGPRVEYDRRDRDRDRARYRDRWDQRTCTTGEAVRKAQRMGVRNARVVDVDRRSIDVAGRRHGDRVRVTFGRGGNCPVLRW